MFCKICNRDYNHSRSSGHRKLICNSCYTTIKRYKLKKKCVDYKGSHCSQCGYNKSLRNLVFHHVDHTKKSFEICGNAYQKSWEVVKEELDKCILLCHHCHNDLHDSENGIKDKIEQYIQDLTTNQTT